MRVVIKDSGGFDFCPTHVLWYQNVLNAVQYEDFEIFISFTVDVFKNNSHIIMRLCGFIWMIISGLSLEDSWAGIEG